MTDGDPSPQQGGEAGCAEKDSRRDAKEAAMTEWVPGIMVGVLVIGAGVLFLVWRAGITDWRGHRRDRREDRREERRDQ
jgi:hypothetical protein